MVAFCASPLNQDIGFNILNPPPLPRIGPPCPSSLVPSTKLFILPRTSPSIAPSIPEIIPRRAPPPNQSGTLLIRFLINPTPAPTTALMVLTMLVTRSTVLLIEPITRLSAGARVFSRTLAIIPMILPIFLRAVTNPPLPPSPSPLIPKAPATVSNAPMIEPASPLKFSITGPKVPPQSNDLNVLANPSPKNLPTFSPNQAPAAAPRAVPIGPRALPRIPPTTVPTPAPTPAPADLPTIFALSFFRSPVPRRYLICSSPI